ncbi:YqaJ viral recombinase family protein [Marinobacter sp. Hex_13]|uniref:YqaJ viral recombinase family protein n=1 Tax=Marinobacter sp. Hex_13 TaxID=1795866 RepID=UPI000796CD38|nr:YqaJ viral recombinase family protein [Marinobacter sp. Hex_13]KXJ45854.1 MAG: hypothetical protein AXW11_12245 [Marinobacter sp. Hex_13]
MKFNLGKLVKVEQGSPEWLALRAERDTASEAPAMVGKSKYQTRNGLMDQKATGVVPEPSERQQKAFDKGHKAEAAARPIADAMIDDELYPVVLDDAEGGYLASMDGLTMCRKIGWEHKWLNADLAAQIDAGELDEHYRIQLDQQFALSGAERILFMASDGTKENCKHLWIERDESRFAALESGWEQFRADLAEYQPRETAPEVTGATTQDLPAVSVQVSGELSIVDNFDRFESALKHFIDEVLVRDPKNDQDFADLDNQVKQLKKAEDALDSAEAQLLAQVEAVDNAKRRKDMLHKLARDNRLMAEKLVKSQKQAIKLEIAQQGKQAVEEHGAKVQATLDGYALPRVDTDFNAAMKGKRTITSLQDAADNEVARAKIAINEAADLIRANANTIADAGYEFLFADRQQLALKDSELVKLEVANRISNHKQEEERRLETERQRIAAEEKAKAESEAQQQAEAESMARKLAESPVTTPEPENPAHVKSEPRAEYKAESTETERPSDMMLLHVIADRFGVNVQTAAEWVLGMSQEILKEVA